jgi:hypothetical protein
MGTKSREYIYGASIRHSAERAAEAHKMADRLACEAWNQRMLGFQGPAQPSPALGDALNAGYLYLDVKCLGCDTHQTVALNVVRRSKATPIHKLERCMRCNDCSQLRGYAYKRSHLVALRPTKISVNDPPSTWWPGNNDATHANTGPGYCRRMALIVGARRSIDCWPACSSMRWMVIFSTSSPGMRTRG